MASPPSAQGTRGPGGATWHSWGIFQVSSELEHGGGRSRGLGEGASSPCSHPEVNSGCVGMG